MSERTDASPPIHARISAIVVAAIMGWLPADARAAPARADADTIAVLPLSVQGELPPTWRSQLQTSLRDGIARGHRPVRPIEPPSDCAEARCWAELGRTHGARWVARGRVVVRDRDFDIVLELFDARDGSRVTTSEASCEVCAIAEVGELLADTAGVLDRKLDALAEAPPLIRFESRPDGALVAVDGELVGRAPIERSIPAGRHRARAELSGHLPLEQEFEAVAGTREPLVFDLSPVPRRDRPLRAVGWGLFGAGAAVAIAGVPLVVLHGRPYRRRCDGTDVDVDGDCRFRYGTRTGGAVLLGIGSAALVTGIVLVVIAAHRKRTGRVSATGPIVGGLAF